MGQPVLVAAVALVTAAAVWSPRTAASGLLTAGSAGWAVTGTFLLPGRNAALLPEGRAMLRSAAWWSAGHAVALLLRWWFEPASGSVDVGLSMSLAAAVTIAGPLVRTRATAAAVTVAAILAGLPPLLSHPNHMLGHQLVMTADVMRTLAVCVWLGTLIALGTRPGSSTAGLVGRYRRLARWCAACVIVAAAAQAWARLHWDPAPTRAQAVTPVLAGGLMLGVLVVLARRLSLAARVAATDRPGVNWPVLLGMDLVVLAALVTWTGMVVGLAGPMPMTMDPVAGLLGFPMPAAPTVARMVGDPLPDLYFLMISAVGLGTYLAGVRRLRRNGHRWPPARTAFWCAGMLILAAVTNLGVSRYSYVLFSAHMAQHMVLSMLVPVLLVSGAPATLALRALRRPTEPGVRGPREWLLGALHSRPLRVLTHPVVAAGIYLGSLYGLYFTSLLGTLMRYHVGHLVMLSHFVAVGYLFFWVLIGVDPGRRRVPHVVLILVHFIVIAAHAIFGVVIMQARIVYTGTWFTIVRPPWAASPVHDQSTGGAIAWAFGEIPAVVVFGILILQWIRDDEREQRRIDRAADRAEAQGREDDELAAYNAFLAAANRQAGGTRR